MQTRSFVPMGGKSMTLKKAIEVKEEKEDFSCQILMDDEFGDIESYFD